MDSNSTRKTTSFPFSFNHDTRGVPVGVVGDPSGQAKDSLFEVNSFDILKQCGLAAEPAPTNDLDPRLRAVEAFFGRNIGGSPAILIDGTRCPTLVAALNGQYKFATTPDYRVAST